MMEGGGGRVILWDEKPGNIRTVKFRSGKTGLTGFATSPGRPVVGP